MSGEKVSGKRELSPLVESLRIEVIIERGYSNGFSGRIGDTNF